MDVNKLTACHVHHSPAHRTGNTTYIFKGCAFVLQCCKPSQSLQQRRESMVSHVDASVGPSFKLLVSQGPWLNNSRSCVPPFPPFLGVARASRSKSSLIPFKQ